MEGFALVVMMVVVLVVVWQLGLFAPVVHLSNVATRESAAYDREHKGRVARRYESLTTDIDVEKVNANIAKIDQLNFD